MYFFVSSNDSSLHKAAISWITLAIEWIAGVPGKFVLNLVLLDGTSDRFRKTLTETMDASKSHTPALPGPSGRDFF